MTTVNHESAHIHLDRFQSNLLILHEVSRNIDMHKDLPHYLAQATGASVVQTAFVEFNQQGHETKREIHASPTVELVSTSEDNDWVKAIMLEASTSGTLTDMVRFVPGSMIRALFVIDVNAVIVFRIQSPSALYMITQNARSLIMQALQYIATVLRQQSRRANSRVRTKPLLRTLTRTEWRVLMALDSEMPEKQIATELATTANTLHSHIKSIYRRLGVQSRLSAIALLRRAERETLIEELQTPRGVESKVSGFDPSHNGSRGASAKASISGPSEPSNLSASYTSFADSDLCAG
ncbi:MAG TPA: helix-turn-helix transcriptional regulator [Phycisphaerae bacterium]|nr:helix-turn-helix transcriptional regulator [Phycisphaerae bacterium]